MASPALEVQDLSFRYGEHVALAELELSIPAGEVFGLLGPNGGGKSTLFRLLATLVPLQRGSVRLFGLDLRTQPAAVRRLLGVTFQSPSLDGRLTVLENLRCQGTLYGLSGRGLKRRVADVLELLGLTDRERQTVETLSGGLKRRVEIAKSMLHRPRFLLLDEPSTGLDPNARLSLWATLEALRANSSVTILVTTHLMEEAERCDRLGILDRGRLVAMGSPDQLRSEVGGDCVTIHSDDLESLQLQLRQQLGVEANRVGGTLRVELPDGHRLVTRLMTELPEQIRQVSLGKPTLEDVFVQKTGHQFWEAAG
jgi:ABC-2 type transport system ATP-binding protein